MRTTPSSSTFVGKKNCILGLTEPEKCCISWYFYICEHFKYHAQVSWVSTCLFLTRLFISDRSKAVFFVVHVVVCHFLLVFDILYIISSNIFSTHLSLTYMVSIHDWMHFFYIFYFSFCWKRTVCFIAYAQYFLLFRFFIQYRSTGCQ